MEYDPPTPPSDLPPDLASRLEECSPGALRAVAEYADGLATHREREARLEEEQETETEEDQQEDLPADVPSKATTTVKEINDNRYYYWQWREGDTVKFQYKGPVSPDE